MKSRIGRICSAFLAFTLSLGCYSCAHATKSELTLTGDTGWGEVISSAGTLPQDTAFSQTESDAANILTAEEGAVLLKNDGEALPLLPEDKVAVFGSRQLWEKTYSTYGFYLGGAGSGAVYGSPRTSPIGALRQKASDGKLTIYEPISAKYAADPKGYVPTAEDIELAKSNGVNKAVYIISRLEGESGTEESFLGGTGVADNAIAPGEWYLSEEEETMMKTLKAAFDKVIVVTNTGNLMDTSWVKNGIDGEQAVDAVLFAWYGGLRAPEALANLLVGDATPSGKLSQTAARHIDDYPTTKDIATGLETGGFYEGSYTNYSEDIFVGYRYFETFDPTYEKVNYEFGYGLSYTDFDISDLNYSFDGSTITVSANITNTGCYSGKEVFQVYFSAPQMGTGSAVLSKPGKELAGFAKTSLLAPGESEIVTVTFPISDMSSYDDTGKTAAKSAWVLEAGDYRIYAGNSVKNVTLAGVYTVDEFTVVEQLTTQLAPYDLEKRLLADGTFEDLELRSKPVPEYTPNYGSAISGSFILECEKYDTILSSSTINKENSSGGTLCETPAYMNEDGTTDFNYANEVFNSYSESNLCWMHVDVRQAVYPIKIAEAGNYKLRIRASSRGNNDFLNLYVNGVLQPLSLNFPATCSSGYFNFVDAYYPESASVYLPSGKVLITLENKNINFPNIDFIEFIRIGETIPDDIVVEGEDYDKTLSTAEISSESYANGGKLAVGELSITNNVLDYDNTEWISYTDGKNLCRMHTKDNEAFYTVNVPQGGIYGLSIRASRSNNPDVNFLSMRINGTRYDYDVAFPQTGPAGAYFNFIDIDFGEKVKIALNSGENTISLISRTGSFPNVDKFTLRYLEPLPEEPENPEEDAPVVYPDGVVTFEDVRQGRNTLDELVAQMTIDELASFTVRTTSSRSAQGSGVGGRDTTTSKFGIPVADTFDGPTGPTAGSGTFGFPSGVAQGCTWNLDLAADFGTVVGKYGKKDGGIHFWLAPGLNIQRSPLSGRNFEYYSEDPLISGLMASCVTEKVQRYGTAATVKHFAANNKETNRSGNDSRVSERALREIYLKGFEICVKETSPISIMTSYNLLNGYETAENYELLKGIARGEWGFDGMFMSDWGNGNILRGILAGHNIKMGSESAGDYSEIMSAYEGGSVSRALLEENAKYVILALTRIDIDEVFDTTAKKQNFKHTLSRTGTTTVEAEEYSAAHKAVNIESRAGASGGKNLGYFDSTDDSGNYVGYAEFDVTVPADSLYDVSMSLSSYNSQCQINFYVDNKLKGDLQLSNTSTGDWGIFKLCPLGTLKLTAGSHKIKVATKSGSFNFDSLVFTAKTNAALSVDIVREYAENGIYPKYSAENYGGTYGSGAVLTVSTSEGSKVLTVDETEATASVGTYGNTVLVFDAYLEDGSYTARIDKNGYVSGSVAFTVADGSAEIPAVTLIPGDIKDSFDALCGDGTVDVYDFIRIIRSFDSNAAQALRNVTDIDEDGYVTILDMSFVKSNYEA